MAELRKCRDCGKYKLLSEYYATSKGRNGRFAFCKQCHKLRSKQWRTANATSSYIRSRNMQRYRMTAADYDRMLAAQGGACALCGDTAANKYAVDHDHSCCPRSSTCGKCVRGIVCYRCNQLLGCAKESVELLRKALTYLER